MRQNCNNMVNYTSGNTFFEAFVQGDAVTSGGVTYAEVFSRSRTMLRFERQDEKKLSVFSLYFTDDGGYNTLPVGYYTDTEGVLEIPLRNQVAKMLTSSYIIVHVDLFEVGGNTVVDALVFTMLPRVGLSYKELGIPAKKDSVLPLLDNGAYVMPPNVILNPVDFAGNPAGGIVVESNYSPSGWSYFYNGAGSAIVPSGLRGNQLAVPPGADTLRVTIGGDTKDYDLINPDSCADLVCVQWTSQTGAVRRHYFPVVAYVKGSDKQVSLVSAGDGYAVDKNTYDAVRCRLTGLTAYGYWYYMDLVQASDVHATLRTLSELGQAQSLAYVDANEMETPGGNGFYNFVFTLKLRHYGSL